MPTDLRPLTLGEILDHSASFWRAHWQPLFKLFLGFELAQFVLLKAWEVVLKKYVPLARGGAATLDALKSQPEEALRQLAWMTASGAVAAAIYLVITNFAAVAGAAFIWPRLLGRDSTIDGAIRRSLARAPAMFQFFGLMLGWTLLIAGLLMLPSGAAIGGALASEAGPVAVGLVLLGTGLALVGMVVAFLWWVLRFLLSSQVIAIEDVGAVGIFRRCDALSSGRIGDGFLGLVKVRLTVLVTVVSVILFTVSIVFGLPALIIQGIYGNMLDPAHATPEAIPEALMVPAQLLQTVAQSAIAPLFVVFTCFFYADMRVRREGLDLALKLEGKP